MTGGLGGLNRLLGFSSAHAFDHSGACSPMRLSQPLLPNPPLRFGFILLIFGGACIPPPSKAKLFRDFWPS